MTETSSPHDEPELSGSILDFTTVPVQRRRYDGWSPETQKRFIQALSAMGSVGAACRALGKGWPWPNKVRFAYILYLKERNRGHL